MSAHYILYLYPPGPVVYILYVYVCVRKCSRIYMPFFIFAFSQCSCFIVHIFFLSFFLLLYVQSHSHALLMCCVVVWYIFLLERECMCVCECMVFFRRVLLHIQFFFRSIHFSPSEHRRFYRFNMQYVKSRKRKRKPRKYAVFLVSPAKCENVEFVPANSNAIRPVLSFIVLTICMNEWVFPPKTYIFWLKKYPMELHRFVEKLVKVFDRHIWPRANHILLDCFIFRETANRDR